MIEAGSDGSAECNRLFPSVERVMMHRKRDHEAEGDEAIISWND